MSADLNSILLQALATPSGGGATSAVTQALLSQFSEDDPTLSVLTKYMAQRQADEQRERERQAEEEEEAELGQCSGELEHARQRSIEMAKAIQHLRGKVEKIYAELQQLRGRNDSLAAALGACHLCWGEDVQCPVCEGKGNPGFAAPDSELFAQFITPVARRFQKRVDARRQLSLNTDPRSLTTDAATKGE